MWGGQGRDLSDIWRGFGEIDLDYRKRELLPDPQSLQRFLHPVRLALHRGEKYARNLLSASATFLEGILRSAPSLVVAN
jgi:hypothetical protein